MKNSYIKSKPTRIIAVVTIAVLCCCLIIFSGCPLPWYIPKKYGDKKMQQIYGFIKNVLLTDCDNYIATFKYSDPNDGVQRVASIFNSGGKALLSFDFYTVQLKKSRFFKTALFYVKILCKIFILKKLTIN